MQANSGHGERHAMTPRLHLCGTGALLMDVAEGPFDLQAQQRLWTLGARGGALERLPGVRQVVLGVNNVLVTFDALVVEPQALGAAVVQAWGEATPRTDAGRLMEVPVAYDTHAGSELEAIAARLQLEVDEVIRLHTSVEYHVAAVGSVPGFPYLVGMSPRLAVPRLQVPRARAPRGSVAIGGAQTGILPMDMPTGWNVIGRTQLALFDPFRDPPALLAPGDRVRFTAAGGST